MSTILTFWIMMLLVLGSLLTTFIAIIQILSNEFKGSKGVWVLISMVAIIGPIIYLTYGRKLIVKRPHSISANY